MEARGPEGGEIKALVRREASLAFLAFLLASQLSLPIASAKALPTVDARLRDCRSELLVEDLGFGLVTVLESEGIRIQLVYETKYKGSSIDFNWLWSSLVVKVRTEGSTLDQHFLFRVELYLLLYTTT